MSLPSSKIKADLQAEVNPQYECLNQAKLASLTQAKYVYTGEVCSFFCLKV